MKTAALIFLTIILGGCSTEFQTFHDKGKIYSGDGGSCKNIDGIDLWYNGTPPKPYRIIGVINDSRGAGLISSISFESAIISKVKKNQGDAAILTDSHKEITGIHTNSTSVAQVSANTYGNTANAYGTSFGTSSTYIDARRYSTFLVIRYVSNDEIEKQKKLLASEIEALLKNLKPRHANDVEIYDTLPKNALPLAAIEAKSQPMQTVTETRKACINQLREQAGAMGASGISIDNSSWLNDDTYIIKATAIYIVTPPNPTD